MKEIPRIILICCEGKTEKSYFSILREVYRGSRRLEVEILGEKGQHKALIDKTVESRKELLKKYSLELDEISSWAVCDDDGMQLSFHQLQKYAQKSAVGLAFSRPQFEAYLIQHFERSKCVDQRVLYEKLTAYANSYGLEGNYEDNKADLRWLEIAVFNTPKMLDTAVLNAELRKSSNEKLFLTVQDLVKELRKHSI